MGALSDGLVRTTAENPAILRPLSPHQGNTAEKSEKISNQLVCGTRG